MRPAVRAAAWAAWPAGLVLVLAHTLGGAFPTPVFLLLDAAGRLALRADGSGRGPAALAVVAQVVGSTG